MLPQSPSACPTPQEQHARLESAKRGASGPQANASTEEVTLWDNFIEPELVEQARLLTMLSLRLSRAVACLLRATLGPAAYVGGLPRTRPVYPRQRTIR